MTNDKEKSYQVCITRQQQRSLTIMIIWPRSAKRWYVLLFHGQGQYVNEYDDDDGYDDDGYDGYDGDDDDDDDDDDESTDNNEEEEEEKREKVGGEEG